MVFIFFKNYINFNYLGKYSYRTALQTKRYFQNKMFKIFLELPLEKHLLNKSSDWVRRLTIDVINSRGEIIYTFISCFR